MNITNFVRECPNALTEYSSDKEDLDGATLQMLSQGDTLNYAEMEGLNMLKARMVPHILPNNCKRGGTYKNIRNDVYLTEGQAKFVYKKVNAGKGINTETIKQEMEQEKLVETEIDNSSDNIYQKAILNEVSKKEKVSAQMEDW